MATRASKPASDEVLSLKQVALEAAKTGAKVGSQSAQHPALLTHLQSAPLSLRLSTRLWSSHAISISRVTVTDLVTDTDRASEEAILKASHATGLFLHDTGD